jgi:hypothetical protein
LLHGLVELHVWQASPNAPHAESEVPAWQAPLESQQPWQLEPLQEPPSPAPVTHTPLEQLWPLRQVVQVNPFEPQAATVLPGWQVRFGSMQPEQVVLQTPCVVQVPLVPHPWQAWPEWPQEVPEVPLRQFPARSQQPAQVFAQEPPPSARPASPLPASPVGAPQLPLLQLSPAPQGAQEAPFAPQESGEVPSWHWPWVSQQPLQVEALHGLALEPQVDSARAAPHARETMRIRRMNTKTFPSP